MKKIFCDFCQENLEFDNNRYVCPICEREWNEVILSDKRYFDLECVKYINPIIALEYQSFDTLLHNKQIYGIILQIKDIYEILIRMPVLIVCSFALRMEKTLKGKELLVYMLSKPLSLGDWRYLLSLSSEVVEELQDTIPNDIRLLVSTIKRFVNSDKNGDIVYWRNSTISHGAAKQLNDEELYDDAASKIEEITQFFKKNEELFQRISFLDENHTELDGLDLRTYKKGKLFVKVEGQEYSLYPFFMIKDEGIFLFDRYVKKIKMTDIIDYVRSVKDSLKFEELNNLFLENSINQFNAQDNMDTYTIEERNLCEEIASGNEFLVPDYLVEIIKQEIEKEKSVFSIQMEKGMGKSYFVKGLDPFSLNNIYIDDLVVKAFYINSTYNSRINDFCICVEDLMRKKSNGFTIANSIIRLDINAEDPKKEFACFLNQYKKKYYYDKKLLFIFDGVDELKRQEGKNIIDFIPDLSDLDEGIYILITLRTNSKDDELSPFIRDYISTFNGTQYYFTRNSEEYLLFAKKYFDLFFMKKLLVFCKKNKIQNNIELAKSNEKFLEIEDKSMLNLNLIRELTLLNLNDYNKKEDFFFDFDQLSFGVDMYTAYFSSIKEYYGSKYYEKFINVLCCLALADRALSLEELSVLSGNNNLNFAFLGFINSMKMFLDTIRDDKGTLFTIGHIERKKIIFSTFKTEIDRLKNELIRRIESVSNSNFNYENIEDNVYYSCLNSIVNSLRIENQEDNQTAKKLFLCMLELPLDFNWSAHTSKVLSEIMILQNIVSFEKFFFNLTKEQEHKKFMVLSKVAFDEMLLKNTSISLKFFQTAIEGYNKEDLSLHQLEDYAETISFYATLLWDLEKNDEAYTIYKKVVEIKQYLNEKDKSIVSNIGLLSEYICLSNIANSAKRYEEQLKCLSIVKENIDKEEESEKKERTLPFMNASFFNYYRDNHKTDEAIESIKKAIQEYEKCAHNLESRMYMPDLVKCIYKYVNYLNMNHMIPNQLDKEVEHFEDVIAYIQSYRGYNDPFSYLKYLLSLYKIYQNISLEKSKKYQERMIDYYLKLDGKYKEDERIVCLMNELKEREEK